MKIEVTLDETKERELLAIINKRLDGMKMLKNDVKMKRVIIQHAATKALSDGTDIASALHKMGNGEFFELIKNC